MTMDPGFVRRFERLLHLWAGQWFPDSRRGELVRAIRRSCERAGFGTDTAAFLAVLEAKPDARLRDLVVHEILVGETYFFRDPLLWEGLEKEIMVDLLQRRSSSRNLRVWSAGCSTGEEAYSLAMLLRSTLPRFDDWTVHLLATDLSEHSLERGRMAQYGRRAVRELDRDRWGRWFETSGAMVRLVEPIRRMVDFRRHNLSHEDFPGPLTNRMDLILCRNVLIYLERDLVYRVIARFAECLRPGGWLILAPTEVPLDPPPGLRLVQLKAGPLVLRHSSPQAAPSPGAGSARTAPARRPLLPLPAAPPTPPAPAPAPAVRAPVVPAAPPPAVVSAEELLAQARAAADRGDLVSALARATSCVEVAPVSPSGWVVLALVQEEMELLADAMESLRRALYLDSGLAVAHLQMARVLVRRGDAGWGRSLANFRKLCEKAESNALLPEGGGLTVGEARHLADQLERTWARSVAPS